MKFDFTKYTNIYCADFETSTDNWNVEEARVWLWDICDNKFNHKNGNSLDSFMNFVIKFANNSLYCFRNLAYDGTYIISWLLNNGYKWTNNDEKFMPNKSFNTVISDIGSHYAYMVKNDIGNKVTFMDSLKYVNMSIEKSAQAYKLPIKKGTIDYDEIRELNHKPTKDELEYIHNDTEIDMHTIILNMKEGAVKFTQAGNARNEFKKSLGKAEYEYLFPELDSNIDKYLRKAYVGGFVSHNEKYTNKVLYNMISLDINSMYPAQMLHRPMPFGYPEGFSGKYAYDEKYPLYIQKIRCCYKLKKNGIAMIATRRAFLNKENSYSTSSDNNVIELTLANPDLELFFDNYDVYNIEYVGGFKFQARSGYEVTPEEAESLSVDEVIEKDGKGSYFYEYIKKWRYIKEHEPSGSPARDYAKRMQNALYGAMATNPDRRTSVPYLDEEGKVKYNIINAKDKGSACYLPAGIFITSWSRYFLIKTINKFYNIFVYCDTDSLYLKGNKAPAELAVHNSLYGFFKIEHKISMFKVIGSKRYIYWGREPNQIQDKFYVTCCGADEDIKKQINFHNFNRGKEFYGKKSVHNVKGGKHIRITTYRLGKESA